MKFLVPTDFSDNAFHAAVYALALAKEKPGSSIHLVHVMTPVVNDPLLVPDIEKEATTSLEQITQELNARCDTCTVHYSVKMGETSTEINKTAEELYVGMIVMGIRGMGKKIRFLFGSNTISLIEKSTHPILVVPESSAFNVPRKIVLATDYYESDIEALQQLIPIATAFKAEIVAVHVFEEKAEEQSELIMINFISAEVSKIVQYPRMTYRVYKSEKIALGIKHFCEFTEADLLVLSARKRSVFERLFHKSVTKELIYNSDIPLLVFHVHKTA